MKRFALCVALAVVLVMGLSSTGLATGVKVDNSSYCNDLWVSAEKLEGAQVYGLHGYEYGCGYETRLITGTLRVTGGYAYFGLTGAYGGSYDYGGLKLENVVITMSSKTGSGYWSYYYFSSGTLTGHGGGPNTYTMSYPQPPPATAEGGDLGPDSAAD